MESSGPCAKDWYALLEKQFRSLTGVGASIDLAPSERQSLDRDLRYEGMA